MENNEVHHVHYQEYGIPSHKCVIMNIFFKINPICPPSKVQNM
jgi:hypothetical protein